MLRKSSTSSKQAIMADYKTKSPSSSSIFNSSRNFNTSNDSESLISPTSILDTKSFSAFNYPFSSDVSSIPTKDSKVVKWEKKLDCDGGVGLGILDALKSKSESPPVVLFCSKLKIEIPPFSINVPYDDSSIKSPSDFGIKTTRNSSVKKKNSNGSEKSNWYRVLSGLSITDLENSEEYTCVVSHGPNPKTTHIFDDCVIESCYGDIIGGSGREESESFLSFCYNCKMNLNQGNDIYIYRGEKAFCSSDCRYKEMNKDNI